MFDAEIAATLLNRWNDKLPESSSIDLLREGSLAFRRHTANLLVDPMSGEGSLELECLTFEDGSRAMRLLCSDGICARTRWAAMEPIQPRREQVSACN